MTGLALRTAYRSIQMQRGLIGSVALLTAMLLSSCAQIPRGPPATVTPFSDARPGGTYPAGWRTLTFSKFRKETRYALVDDCGSTVVEARADGSSSGLIQLVDIDPRQYPWLTWRWKVLQSIPGVDNTRRDADDAPARIDISFDGDWKKLTIADRLWAAQVKAVTGVDLPYATLEYVWGDGASTETVIENTWTARIRMIVVESGAGRVGQWVTETRNISEDYQRAFGEPPGRITAVGIITDTDATGTKAEALYGDIAFLPAKPANAQGGQVASASGGGVPAGDRRPGLDCPAQAGNR